MLEKEDEERIELISSLNKKVEIMNKEFDFLKSELEANEGKVKTLKIEKESLEMQINDLKE
jgi:capsule polysaccharide export protein KpsE/RkpR